MLGIADIGVRDNFFELGGDSLLATQLVMRARDEFRVELPLRNLFETPTIEGVCEAIQLARREMANEAEIEELLAEIEGSTAEGSSGGVEGR